MFGGQPQFQECKIFQRAYSNTSKIGTKILLVDLTNEFSIYPNTILNRQVVSGKSPNQHNLRKKKGQKLEHFNTNTLKWSQN